MKELIIKRCMKCGATVEVLKDCTCENCGIKCCGEQMQIINPNENDNNVLSYEVKDNNILVKANNLNSDETIEWFALVDDERIGKKFIKDKFETEYPYISGSKIYAYTSKNLLWSCDIK